MNDNISINELPDQGSTKWYQNIAARLILILVLVAILPLIASSAWNLYTMQQSNLSIVKQSEAAMTELGEAAIYEKAETTARQIRLYLETHPEIDPTDTEQLESNTALAQIAVQPVGQTGYTAVFDQNGITHFHSNPAIVGMDMSTLGDTFPEFWAIFEAALNGSTSSGYYDWEDASGQIRPKYMSTYPVGGTGLRVAATTYIDEFSQPANNLKSQLAETQTKTRNQILMVIAGTILLSLVGAHALSRQFSSPIRQLTDVAKDSSIGKAVPVNLRTRHDEIGELARSFHDTSRQLQKNMADLEQRARNMEANVEISRHITTVLDQRRLVEEIVTQLQSAFNYYHAQIYLYQDGREDLELVSASGEAGATMLRQGYKISLGQGPVGRAAATNTTVLALDVTLEPDWQPNPLLPETKSEIAVPITLGEKVMGVLAVQQDSKVDLTKEDMYLLQFLANQVAVALRNAHLFEQVERQVTQQMMVNEIGQKIQTATDLDQVLQVTAQELGQTLGVKRATVRLSRRQNGNGRIQENN